MQKIILYVLMSCLFQVYGLSQLKHDYYWPMGNDQSMDSGVQAFEFDFNELPMEPSERDRFFSFDRCIGSICDSEGKLLFYTNGCFIADSNHERMENGDSLNYNNYYELRLNEGCEFGYPSKQDLTILPDPGYDKGYYIIHKPNKIRDTTEVPYYTTSEEIFLSYVDMSLNNGLGKVTTKRDTLISVKYLQGSHMTAINHDDGESWWILQPSLTPTGNMYYRMLLDETGIAKVDSQAIGPQFIPEIWPTKSRSGGHSKFSQDGTMYAYFNLYDGLHLYDFDRETGLLSNGRYLEWAPMAWYNQAGSVEFSPNSKFLYLVNQYELFQIDLAIEDLSEGIHKIADADTSIIDPFTMTFFMMSLGPDCKIYIRPGSSTNVMSTIHNPNGRGQECDLRQADLVLPRTSSAGGFPNFPPFRVDEENKCDPSISMVDGFKVFWRRDLSIYPSPASTSTTVDIPEGMRGWLCVLDMLGHRVWQEEKVTGRATIDLSTLPEGIYSVEFLPEDNVERVVYTAALVKN